MLPSAGLPSHAPTRSPSCPSALPAGLCVLAPTAQATTASAQAHSSFGMVFIATPLSRGIARVDCAPAAFAGARLRRVLDHAGHDVRIRARSRSLEAGHPAI